MRVYLDLRGGGAPGSTREEAEAGGRGGFVRGRRPAQGMIPGHPFLSPLEHVPLGCAATGPAACERPYRACVRARARADLGHPLAIDPMLPLLDEAFQRSF